MNNELTLISVYSISDWTRLTYDPVTEAVLLLAEVIFIWVSLHIWQEVQRENFHN